MSSLGAKSCTFWHDTSSIRPLFDTSGIKHPFGTTRNHGLDFTTANLLWPNFTNSKHSLLTNENQQLKLLFSKLEQQLPGRRTQSLIVKSYIENFERKKKQFDQLIAPVVTFYSIKSRLHVDGETQLLLWTPCTRNGCNDAASIHS